MTAIDRPAVISHLIAAALGLGWGALVALAPPTAQSITLVRPEELATVEVEFTDDRPPAEDPAPEPPPPAAGAPRPAAPSPPPAADKADAARAAEAAFSDAFGGAAPTRARGMVGDVSNVLRGVAVTAGDGGRDGATAGGGKKVIAYGAGGEGARTPGRGYDPEVAAAAGGIAGVSGVKASVGKASIAIAAPEPVRGANAAPPGRDVARLGTFVRSRQQHLRVCYEEHGLKSNPSLAGTIAVEVNLDAGGAVMGARVTRRSWSGDGTAEVEACVLERVSEWTFPASSGDLPEKYAFSFVFAR